MAVFGVGFAFPERSAPQFSCPSLAAAGRCLRQKLSKAIFRLFLFSR
ncbi:MAG: hypothetical protein GQF41_4592 [Candidatus Rifleibacterium amylolyticum]|nr:MAG: hypothetical protein GQF41_4592 [Candidatus Rifleibacterium amylolyticum]